MEYSDKYRMYGLVPYNISPIQQAIQYGHALQEYNNMMIGVNETSRSMDMMSPDDVENTIEAFDIWRNICKTFIILNGGTTNDSQEYIGTMNDHEKTLKDMKWPSASFREPDLGNQLTAVVFLLPEQVYNCKLYPEFWDWDQVKKFDDRDLRKFKGEWDWETSFDDETARALMIYYMRWTTEVMGSNENVNMRKWVSQFRLA